MEYFTQNPVLTIVCALLTLVLALLSVLIARMVRRDQGSKNELDALRGAVLSELETTRQGADTQAARSREEIHTGLRGFNDAVIRVVGDMTRAQQGQLDSFAGQLRTMSRENHDRMDDMQRSVENRLAQYEQRVDRMSAALDDKLTKTDRGMSEIRATVDARMADLADKNEKKLEDMRLTLDDRLHATLDQRLGDSFRLVSARLEQVYSGLSEMQALAVGVGDLKRVLTHAAPSGVWGEVQLSNLLAQILPAGQFVSGLTLSPGGRRIDCAVRLPAQGDADVCYLPLDAQFPQAEYISWLRAVEDGDPHRADALGRQMETALRMHARLVSENFVKPPQTTDFAIIYLPIEGLYAELLKRPGLSEQILADHRVILCGPTTLAAMLSSLNMGFRTLAIEQRSSEVWKLLGGVKTEFARFADALSRTQRKLRQASESIEDATRKSRSIQRKLVTVGEIESREARRMMQYGEDETDDEDGDGDGDEGKPSGAFPNDWD